MIDEDSPAVNDNHSLSIRGLNQNQSNSKQEKTGKLKKKLKGVKSESKIQTTKRILDIDCTDMRFKRRLDLVEPDGHEEQKI